MLDGLEASALDTRLSAAGFMLTHAPVALARGWGRRRNDLTGRPVGRPLKAER